MTAKKKIPKLDQTTRAIEEALERAAKRAREVARMHGTSVYILKNGKVMAEKP